MTIPVRRRIAAAALAAVTLALGAAAHAQMSDPAGAAQASMVGGAAMYPSRNIIQNAVNSKDHTTLVSAVKAAGLVDTLQSDGPFTVFAPTNEAFAKLPSGAAATLMDPANRARLAAVLTYHVVPGRLAVSDLLAKVEIGGGVATLTTVEGEPLTLTATGQHVWLKDVSGRTARITIGDVMQSNGVIHVVDRVLLPK